MNKKIVIRVLLIVIFIIIIKPHIWHSFEDNYSIQGTVKSVNFVSTYDKTPVVYVHFETTDGVTYNFQYYQDPSPLEEAESFHNLMQLNEGDEVELSIHSVGYYFVNSEKKHIAIYVKDVKWLK